MFFAFILLLAVVVGGLLGMLIVRDSGYVLISYGDWAVETSIWMAAILVLVLYGLIRATLWLWRGLGRGQIQFGRWRLGRKARVAREQTVRGLLLMAEGRWEEAKKTFTQNVSHVETPLINYLNAARAAHELGQAEERDRYLKRAHETTPGAKFAAMLTQAEFQMDDGLHEQALATLLNLKKKAPKHGAVMQMLARCYEALGDWQALKPYLAELADSKGLPKASLRRLSRRVWQAELERADDVARVWKQLPKALKSDVDLLLGWVDHLMHAGRGNDAEHAARLALEQVWDAALVQRYGCIQGADAERQLLVAQDWARARPGDVDLALAQGRLSLQARQFQKAREYFDAALRLEPREDIYAELGRLCIALGDERRGADYLLKATGDLPDLPLPSEPTMRSGVY